MRSSVRRVLVGSETDDTAIFFCHYPSHSSHALLLYSSFSHGPNVPPPHGRPRPAVAAVLLSVVVVVILAATRGGIFFVVFPIMVSITLVVTWRRHPIVVVVVIITFLRDSSRRRMPMRKRTIGARRQRLPHGSGA